MTLTYGTDPQADAGCDHVTDLLTGHCGRCGRLVPAMYGLHDPAFGDQCADTDGLAAEIAGLKAGRAALVPAPAYFPARALHPPRVVAGLHCGPF